MSNITALDVVLWQEVFRNQAHHINAATSGDPAAVVRSYLDFAAVADHVLALRLQHRAASQAQQQQQQQPPHFVAPAAVKMQQPTHLSMAPTMPPNVQAPLPPGGKVEIYQPAPPAPPLIIDGPPATVPGEVPAGLPVHTG